MVRSISKFSSLNFNNNWRLSFQKPAEYVQFFAFSDGIRVQLLIDSGTDLQVYLNDFVTGKVTTIPSTEVEKSENTSIQEVYLQGRTIEPGCYSLEIKDGSTTMAVSYFNILDDDSAELENTVLLSYTHHSNFFDVHFADGDETYRYFNIRVEGGFLPDEVSFGVDQENFRDQRFNLSQLSALPYTMKTLTVGSRTGVPYWMGEKMNLLFSCDSLTIDGVYYVRGDNAIPEVNPVVDNYPMMVYKIQVEKDDFYNYDLSNALKIQTSYTWGNYVNIYEEVEEVITYIWGDFVNIWVQDLASYSDDYSDDYQR